VRGLFDWIELQRYSELHGRGGADTRTRDYRHLSGSACRFVLAPEVAIIRFEA
jgi:hypothetical protein